MNSSQQKKWAPSGGFTYREYLEFTGPEEFKRFRHMPVITDRDIADVEWGRLLVQLISE